MDGRLQGIHTRSTKSTSDCQFVGLRSSSLFTCHILHSCWIYVSYVDSGWSQM